MAEPSHEPALQSGLAVTALWGHSGSCALAPRRASPYDEDRARGRRSLFEGFDPGEDRQGGTGPLVSPEEAAGISVEDAGGPKFASGFGRPMVGRYIWKGRQEGPEFGHS